MLQPHPAWVRTGAVEEDALTVLTLLVLRKLLHNEQVTIAQEVEMRISIIG